MISILVNKVIDAFAAKQPMTDVLVQSIAAERSAAEVKRQKAIDQLGTRWILHPSNAPKKRKRRK